MHKVNLTEKYELRGSREPMRVLCIDGGGPYPVVVLDGSGLPWRFKPDGRCMSNNGHQEHECDLVAVQTAPQITLGLWRMRNGEERIVVCTNSPGAHPVICVSPCSGVPSTRSDTGRLEAAAETHLDLVERIGDWP